MRYDSSPFVDDMELRTLDLPAAEVDVPGSELADEEQVFEDPRVGADGVRIDAEVAGHAVEAGQAA